jgi:hypothetical protein
MKRVIIILFALLPIFAAAQNEGSSDGLINKGSGILYFEGRPNFDPTPFTDASEFAIDLNTKKVYVYSGSGSVWNRYNAIDTLSTLADTANVDNRIGQLVYVNAVDQFWTVNSAGSWEVLSGQTSTKIRQGVKIMAKIAGQSNSTGVAPNSDLSNSLRDTARNIKICDQYSGAWESLKIGYNNNGGVNNSGGSPTDSIYHGPEAGIITEFANLFPDDTLYLLKTGYGGTEISRHLVGGTQDAYNQDSISSQTCMNLLLNRPDVDAIDFRGELWIQGESDATSDEKAYAYAAKLDTLIEQKRRRYGADYPLFFGEVNESQNNTNPRDIINQTLRYKARYNSDIFAVEMSELPTIANGDSHYSSSSMIEIGKRFTRAFAGMPSYYITDTLPSFLPIAPVSTWNFEEDFEGFTPPTVSTDFQDCRGNHEIVSYQSSNRIHIETGTETTVGACQCCNASNTSRSLFRLPNSVIDTTTTDMTVQTKVMYDAGGSTVGSDVVLRYRSNGQAIGYSGYVFWINFSTDQFLLGRYLNGNFTQIGASQAFVTDVDTEYLMRYSVIGTTLTAETSIDGGVTWSTVASGTDANIASGGVGFGAGIGSTGNDGIYYDEIKVRIE